MGCLISIGAAGKKDQGTEPKKTSHHQKPRNQPRKRGTRTAKTGTTDVLKDSPRDQSTPNTRDEVKSDLPTTTTAASPPYRNLSITSANEWARSTNQKSLRSIRHEFTDMRKRPNPNNRQYNTFSKYGPLKNRHMDIQCWDETRVKLPFGPDYIHASYVDGYNQEKDYICTQAPMERTVNDFWQMIWKENVIVIVMLCHLVEDGIEKCAKYYPTTSKSHLSIGPFHLKATDQKEVSGVMGKIVFTSIEVKNTAMQSDEPIRTVNHIQHLNWPERKPPIGSGLGCVEFIDTIRRMRAAAIEAAPSFSNFSISRSPILVHCSDGTGRTGTLVAIAVCRERFESSGRVNVRSTVEAIRKQRKLAVQTQAQYFFCFQTMLEYLDKTNPKLYHHINRNFAKKVARQPR